MKENHSMIKRLALFALLLTTACTTTTSKTNLDRFIEKTIATIPDVPSVSVAVVRDGRPYYVGAVGMRNVENRTPADAETGYYMGSTTKAFTGLACAILAQQGKLDLDAPISRYLPELTSPNVTLRAFLTHTSAVENDAIVFRTAFSGEHTPQQLVSLLQSSKSRKPGFQYDNLGYVVASLIIERITGHPWQKVLDEMIFTPLGMNHTSAYMSEAATWTLASPYQPDRKGNLALLAFQKNDQMMHAAGGTVTTASDLARWLEANINKGRVDGRQVLPAAAFEEAQQMQVPIVIERADFKSSNYGFGWYQGMYDGDNVLFHGGGFEGWNTFYSFMPDKKIGVGVMTNASGPVTAVLTMISEYVYDSLLEKPDVETKYAERLAKLAATNTQRRSAYVAEIEKRAKRPWMLQHPNPAYAGRYENPLYGTLTIEQRGDALQASIGRLRGDLEAFTEPESARVELIPGTGEVLRFQIGNDGNAETLRWRDEVFRRIPQ
jgi:CubicO group peptidase (beta-lactamase class C family)